MVNSNATPCAPRAILLGHLMQINKTHSKVKGSPVVWPQL